MSCFCPFRFRYLSLCSVNVNSVRRITAAHFSTSSSWLAVIGNIQSEGRNFWEENRSWCICCWVEEAALVWTVDRKPLAYPQTKTFCAHRSGKSAFGRFLSRRLHWPGTGDFEELQDVQSGTSVSPWAHGWGRKLDWTLETKWTQKSVSEGKTWSSSGWRSTRERENGQNG